MTAFVYTAWAIKALLKLCRYVLMASSRLEKLKFSVERKAKSTRRVDVYFFVLAAVFVMTFILTQVLLGVYYV